MMRQLPRSWQASRFAFFSFLVSSQRICSGYTLRPLQGILDRGKRKLSSGSQESPLRFVQLQSSN